MGGRRDVVTADDRMSVWARGYVDFDLGVGTSEAGEGLGEELSIQV